MTPPARIAAAIELLAMVEAASRKPADAVANAFFRDRRFIGSGDRRAVSERVWSVMRARRRLGWWLERARVEVTPRLLVAASLFLEGWTLEGVKQSFSGGQFGPTHLSTPEAAALKQLEGHTLSHPAMPEAVQLEVPDWLVPHLRARFADTLGAEMDALGQPASLDLRVNLLKGTREQAIVALAGEGIAAVPTELSPWAFGWRVAGW